MRLICLSLIGLCALSACSKLDRHSDDETASANLASGNQSSSTIFKQAIYCRLYMDAKPESSASIFIQYKLQATENDAIGAWQIRKSKSDDLGLPFTVKVTAQSDPNSLPFIWLVENEEGFLGKVTWEVFKDVEAMEMTFVSNKFSEPVLGHCVRLPVPARKAKANNS
jgi:hypothetical protein